MIELLLSIKLFFSNVLSSLGTLIKIVLLSKFITKLNKIEPKNKKVIILANGPSLKSFDTQRNYGNFDFLTVNHSPSSKLFSEIRPKYHIIIAPELWKTDVSDYFKKASKELFGQLKDKVCWPMVLFIPFNARKYKKWQNTISANKNIQVFYFNSTPVEGLKRISHLLFRLNLGMPRPHNVLIPSLLLLINMGFEQIYLLGADHSWLKEINVTEQNIALISLNHFYDEKKVKAHTMSKIGKGRRTLHEMLHKLYLTFQGYFIIRDYAKSRNVQIFNSTKGSYIDAFERREIEDE